MSGREDFERRLGASIREFVETAPTEIDAGRLAHSLATSEPRLSRLVPRPRPDPRWPSLNLAWVAVAAVVVLALGMNLLAVGPFRHASPVPGAASPTHAAESPLVTPSSGATTPRPSATPAPSLSPHASGQPEDVVFTSFIVDRADGPNTGTFNATGQAVEMGLVCQHGTVVDLEVVDSGAIGRGSLTDFTVPKQFSCDDGSGSFVLELRVHVETPGIESLQWQILRGTGAYADLQGAGTGTTTSPGPSQAINTLTGSLLH